MLMLHSEHAGFPSSTIGRTQYSYLLLFFAVMASVIRYKLSLSLINSGALAQPNCKNTPALLNGP